MKVGGKDFKIESIAPSKAPYDECTKVLLVVSPPLPTNHEYKVKFTGLMSNRYEIVPAKSLASNVIMLETPDFPFPEAAKVSLITKRSEFQLAVCLQEFHFTSNLITVNKLLAKVNDPINFMCAANSVSPRCLSGLDEQLKNNFSKSIPPNFDLLKGDGLQTLEETKYHTEFPTLLHFAARYGMYKLCCALLRCHGGHKALNFLNKDDMTPELIAEHHGYKAMYAFLAEIRQKSNYRGSMYTEDQEIYESLYDTLTANVSNEVQYEDMKFHDIYEVMEDNEVASLRKDVIVKLTAILKSPVDEVRGGIESLLRDLKTRHGSHKSENDSENWQEDPYEVEPSDPDDGFNEEPTPPKKDYPPKPLTRKPSTDKGGHFDDTKSIASIASTDSGFSESPAAPPPPPKDYVPVSRPMRDPKDQRQFEEEEGYVPMRGGYKDRRQVEEEEGYVPMRGGYQKQGQVGEEEGYVSMRGGYKNGAPTIPSDKKEKTGHISRKSGAPVPSLRPNTPANQKQSTLPNPQSKRPTPAPRKTRSFHDKPLPPPRPECMPNEYAEEVYDVQDDECESLYANSAYAVQDDENESLYANSGSLNVSQRAPAPLPPDRK